MKSLMVFTCAKYAVKRARIAAVKSAVMTRIKQKVFKCDDVDGFESIKDGWNYYLHFSKENYQTFGNLEIRKQFRI